MPPAGASPSRPAARGRASDVPIRAVRRAPACGVALDETGGVAEPIAARRAGTRDGWGREPEGRPRHGTRLG